MIARFQSVWVIGWSCYVAALTFLWFPIACQPFEVGTHQPHATQPAPRGSLAEALMEILPPAPQSRAALALAFREESPEEIRAAMAPPEPVHEIRIYPPVGASHINVGPPPVVNVMRLPGPTRPDFPMLVRFSTKGQTGDPARNAWIIVSENLELPPVNWGTAEEPVLQMVGFDLVLPFPAGVETDHGGSGMRFHRQEGDGWIDLTGTVLLGAPLYLQLIVAAPEENSIGYVTSFAHGLIPGGR